MPDVGLKNLWDAIFGIIINSTRHLRRTRCTETMRRPFMFSEKTRFRGERRNGTETQSSQHGFVF